MNDWRSTSRFPRKIQDRCLVLKLLMRELGSQEIDVKHENTLGMRTEGLHVDFAQHVNFSPCGGFQKSGTQFWLWKLVSITYWGSTSRFLKRNQSFPLILWLQICRSFNIRNSIMSKKIHQNWPLRVYTSIVQKCHLNPLTMKLQFWGFKVSGTKISLLKF